MKKLDFIYRPYVFIKLGNGNKWSKNFIRSLIDSGADYNVFPSAFAKDWNPAEFQPGVYEYEGIYLSAGSIL